ncbi:MAG: tRNA (adenosine(37)-N6)-threonylcarbamoyltransferase complex transferase subunit TsaD [Gemmatimonadota bacterium]|nr:tRNA (adenosine(37)-N6)-threonylcarbamoyltransferase complex transferase subunit TsaD [Gemmatimonadota bacterium]
MADLILGIETSCDETSAAVLRMDGGRATIAGLVILSQDVHRIFGGVVPELASRAHVRAIGPVVDQALADAGASLEEIEGIAVTAGPGLIGALLVGVGYGKTLAWRLGKPLIGVHHHEGHLFAPTLEDATVAPPFVALLVSGGHTVLLDVPAWGSYRVLGRTRDDAAGEAFDKVGTLLGLGYPAGAEIERLAARGNPDRFRFPRPMLKELQAGGADQFTFSFSGLKTALLRATQASTDLAADCHDLARGFQDAAVEVLAAKTAAAAAQCGYPTVVLAGGVACNRALAAAVRERIGSSTRLAVASPRLNTDNAAMIAAAGAWHLARGDRSGWDLEAYDSRELGG